MRAELEGYTEAITRLIPTDIMDQAKKIVSNHRNPNIPEGAEPVCLAKILIVDDEKDLAELLGNLARRRQHDPTVSYDAKSAIDLIGNGDFSQVVCDGLEGDWSGVYDEAKKRGIGFTIVSSSSSVGKDARELGIRFISKNEKDVIRELSDFFINLQISPKT